MLNDTLNETHESDEPLNDTTLESDDEPVNTEPSIETENLKHNVVSHLEVVARFLTHYNHCNLCIPNLNICFFFVLRCYMTHSMILKVLS